MLFKLTPISIAVFIAALVDVFFAYSSWQRRKTKGGVYFAFALMAITFWTLAYGLDYAAVPVDLKVFFAKLEYLGYTSAIALFAAFALSYAGHDDWLKKTWVIILLVGIPASNTLLAWTNDLHGWVWPEFRMSETIDNALIFEHGPGFTWVTLSSYVLILIIFASLLSAILKGSEQSRKQARLVLIVLLVLVASHLLFLFEIFSIPGVDWSSVEFSVAGPLFLFALYGWRFMDVIPVARNSMIERMADGVLVLGSLGHLVDFNPAAQSILGVRREDLWTPFQAALARWPEIVAWLENPARPEAKEITIEKTAENGVKNFDLRLTPLKDNRNHLYGLLVVMREITQRKKAEALLRLRLRLWEFSALHPVEELMQKALDEIGGITSSPIGFYHFVEKDQNTLSLQAWSTRTRAEFCKADGEGMHYPISEAGVWVDCVHEKKPVIHNDYASLPHRKGMPDGHAAVIRELVVPTLRDDRVVSILGVGNKSTDYDDEDVELVRYIADIVWSIIEQKQANEQIHLLNSRLERLAMTDELTGLANRRAFFQRGGEEIRRIQRYQSPLSLIMLDIDRFKDINDTYGHAAGDIVLQGIANILQANIRQIDVPARLGGEEFGILLLNTGVADAAKLAERLRLMIEKESYEYQGETMHVTVSIGVTEFGSEMLNLDAILSKADSALYLAKNQGRNRVVFLN